MNISIIVQGTNYYILREGSRLETGGFVRREDQLPSLISEKMPQFSG